MWNSLPVKDRMGLMKSYKEGGFTYSGMVKDYNDSYQKFENGGGATKPYITNDLSDPRIRLYADSARSYSNELLYQQFIKKLPNNKSLTWYENKHTEANDLYPRMFSAYKPGAESVVSRANLANDERISIYLQEPIKPQKVIYQQIQKNEPKQQSVKKLTQINTPVKTNQTIPINQTTATPVQQPVQQQQTVQPTQKTVDPKSGVHYGMTYGKYRYFQRKDGTRDFNISADDWDNKRMGAGPTILDSIKRHGGAINKYEFGGEPVPELLKLPVKQSSPYQDLNTYNKYTGPKDYTGLPEKNTFNIVDNRYIDPNTGKNIKGLNKFGAKNVSTKSVEAIIKEAKNRGVSPMDAITSSYLETQLGTTGNMTEKGPALYHLNPDYYGINATSDPSVGLDAYQKQMEYAKSLQRQGKVPQGENYTQQGFAGYGTIKKGHYDLSGAKKIYGKDIPKEGISALKTPDYGNRFINVRDSILTQNPEIKNLIFKYNNYQQDKHEYGGQINKYEFGGEHDRFNKPLYNPSETVNQVRFEDPYKKAANLNQADKLAEQDYINEQVAIKQNEDKTRVRIRKQNELDKSKGIQKNLYDEDYEVKSDIEYKEYKKKTEERTNTMMLELGLLALPVAGEFIGAKYLKNAWKYNPNKFKTNPNNYYHRSPNPFTTIKDQQFIGYGKTEEGAARLAKEIAEHHKKFGKRNSWVDIKKPVKDEPYFSKGVGLDGGRTNSAEQNFWAGQEGIAQEYPGPYLVEAKNHRFIAKTDGKLQRVLNKDGVYETGIPPTELGRYAVPVRGSVPAKNIKIYKEHWWDGYRPDSDNYRTIFKP